METEKKKKMMIELDQGENCMVVNLFSMLIISYKKMHVLSNKLLFNDNESGSIYYNQFLLFIQSAANI